MQKIASLACFTLLMLGCSTTGAKNFSTPSTNNETHIFLIGENSSEDANIPGMDLVDLATICPQEDVQEAASATVIPLVAALGQYIFEAYQDRKLRELANLKKAAQKTYSGNVLVEAKELKSARCAVIVRVSIGKGGEKNTGLVAAVSLKHFNGVNFSGFTQTPIYVKAQDSVAITHKAKDDKPSLINVTVGVAVKAIGLDQSSNVPKSVLTGSGASTVAKVELGENTSPKCFTKPCSTSDVIPHISADEDYVTFSMSVTESGVVGIDFEQREAEIEALKAAFGPAINAAITAELTPSSD